MTTKRSIFEEVSETGPRELPPRPKPQGMRLQRDRFALRAWLALLFVLTLATLVVGGLTRLMDAGLAIVAWEPVSGIMPPMSAEAWSLEFSRYQTIPEFQLQNSSMNLETFKTMYWWEWSHRILARLVGLCWAVGLGWFLYRRSLPAGLLRPAVVLGLLGGLQGLIGWWMVSSGLQGRMVDVASYRLAIHAGLAFAICAIIYWLWMKLGRSDVDLLQARRGAEGRLGTLTSALIGLIFLQIALGAIVAGLDAGRGFPTWPLMNGEIFPSESLSFSPTWINVFENPALAQFNHRLAGYVLTAAVIFAWFRSRRSPHRITRQSFDLLLVLTALQVLLGIMTTIYGAPWQAAILHQVGALAMLMAAIRSRQRCSYPIALSARGQRL